MFSAVSASEILERIIDGAACRAVQCDEMRRDAMGAFRELDKEHLLSVAHDIVVPAAPGQRSVAVSLNCMVARLEKRIDAHDCRISGRLSGKQRGPLLMHTSALPLVQ